VSTEPLSAICGSIASAYSLPAQPCFGFEPRYLGQKCHIYIILQ
jgi:hypothetical protein